MLPTAHDPAAQAPASIGPAVLTVVADRAAADRLPAAAARARGAGARLLIVALARPRTGFTTDPVVLRHAAERAREEMRRLQQVAHQMLRDCGVDYEVVAMPYRNSRVPAKRDRRISAAMHRLARVRGAQLLPPGAVPDAARRAGPGQASPGHAAHVVAVVPDSVEAVRVARAAGELALAMQLPLALVVPLPALGTASRPEDVPIRTDEDMAAIAGRAQPALDLLGVQARVVCAPYRTERSASSTRRSMATAVENAARRLRSRVVVVSEAFPALAHLRIPADGLHVVAPTVPKTPGQGPSSRAPVTR